MKIAFLVKDRLEEMVSAETLIALKNQGYQLVRVAPGEIGTSGEKPGRGFAGRRKDPPNTGTEEFDALLILDRYSLHQLKMNKRLVKFVAAFLESGKPVWTDNPGGTISVCH